MESSSILEIMAEKYANCKSYSDSGTVVATGLCGIQEVTFKTHFLRPDKFYFEWSSYHPYFKKAGPKYRDLIWSNGLQTFEFFHFNESPVLVPNLRTAVAGATGISDMSVVIVFPLLLPGAIDLSRTILTLKSVARLADERIDGADCYHLSGIWVVEDDVELWISKEDLAIRRMRDQLQVTPALSVTYDRKFDSAEFESVVDAERFEADAWQNET